MAEKFAGRTSIEKFWELMQSNFVAKENRSNKVTSLSSSSTHEQYPSAKTVYDIIGDIESLLEDI